MSRALLSICLIGLTAVHAAADPAGEQLFRDGRTLLKAGKIDEACEKFQQSRDVEAKFGTVLNLGDCRERQGKLATAWELFLEAKGLATAQKGASEIALAEGRAKKIAGKRAFLTIAIPAEHRVPGLVVTRNGIEVAASTWDQALPIDPGSYEIEAKATGYESATITTAVAAKAKVTATVPALVKLAVVEPPPPDKVITVIPPGPEGPEPGVYRKADVPRGAAPASISPRLRTAALGLGFGFTHEGDVTIGARLIIQTPFGPGAIRGIFVPQYTKETPVPGDSGADSDRYAFWFGAEYLLAWRPGFASAFGAGYGIEVVSGGYDVPEGDSSFTKGWPSLRVSPIIARLSSTPLEIGLHALLDFRNDIQSGDAEPILVTTLALDWFFR